MKVTLTNGEIYAMATPLGELMNQKLPVRVSYKLANLGAKIEGQLKIINETRKSLIRKHGTGEPGQEILTPTVPDLDGEGKPKVGEDKKELTKPNPAMQAFSADFAEVLDETVDIEWEDKIKLPEKVAATCDKCHHNMDKDLEIEPRILMAVAKFVEVV
jgi:hypothetical protein